VKSLPAVGFLGLGLLLPVCSGFGADPIRLKWRGSGGWGDKSAYCTLFDVKTVETMQGTILSIDPVTPIPGMSEGVRLQLKTAKGDILYVHLGPRWYLENQDIDLQPQDAIAVTGSKIHCEGESVVAAAEVRKGDQVIKLRDANGRPLWTAAARPQ
jgi:hypothetical protein